MPEVADPDPAELGRNQYLLEGRGGMWNRRAGEEPAERKGIPSWHTDGDLTG